MCPGDRRQGMSRTGGGGVGGKGTTAAKWGSSTSVGVLWVLFDFICFCFWEGGAGGVQESGNEWPPTSNGSRVIVACPSCLPSVTAQQVLQEHGDTSDIPCHTSLGASQKGSGEVTFKHWLWRCTHVGTFTFFLNIHTTRGRTVLCSRIVHRR